MVQSGTVFLASLRRRAKADYRLHLAETAAVAALAGGLTSLRINEAGLAEFAGLGPGLIFAGSTAGLWLVLGILQYGFFLSVIRGYITALLVDTGLLYLVIEHDPHDCLTPLRRRETLSRLKLNPQSELSFRGRILVFLRTYGACAGALGFHAYPALVRWVSRLVDYGLLIATGIFVLLVYRNVINAMAYHVISPLPLKLASWLLLFLLLSRATIAIARRSGLWLALTDLLIEDSTEGKAILAGR